MTYTVEQVEEAIRAWEEAGDEDGYGYGTDFFDDIMWSPSDPIFLPILGEKAIHVEREGGSEGDGDHMHVVFRIGDQFFMKEGYHNSWDSNEWDGDFNEVKPVEVTVTQYRPIENS